MTHDWAEARRWAEDQAQSWFEASSPYTVGGVQIGWPLQIAAFEAFLRVAESSGVPRPMRDRILPRQLLKRHGLDRVVRTVAVRLLTARVARPFESRGGVLFLSEIPTPSAIEPSVLVANAFMKSDVEVAVADPRALRIWRRGGYHPRPIVLPVRDEVALFASSRREAKREWKRYVDTSPRFVFGTEDLTRAALGALRPIVTNSAPWLPIELAALRSIVRDRRPASIAVGTDQDRIGRLACVVAAETATPLVVLQHGLPQTAIAYLPVVASRVAVWSSDVRDWFVTNGTAAHRVVVTGNPRLDRLAALSRRAERSTISKSTGLGGSPRLLVALSPLDVGTNLRVMEVALAALRDLPSSSAVIKLHPGHGDNRSIVDLVRRSGIGSRVRVFRQEPLLPLLLWADLTLLFRSSVAIESLAAGTPVAVADIGSQSIADDELRSLDLPRVGNGNELRSVLSELATLSGSTDYFHRRSGALERQIGPFDGMASRRIADLLRAVT